MGGGTMGGFAMKKPKPSEPKTIEEPKVTELDKLKVYINKKNFKSISDTIIREIEKNYIEGISDYDKCKEFIDICSINEDYFNSDIVLMVNQIYILYMNTTDSLITTNLLNLILKQSDNLTYIKYALKSRSYFTDSESWASRIFEVINEDINVDTALNEDKMRLGIYTNISNEEISDLNKKIDAIKLHVNSLNYNIEQNGKYIEKVNVEIKDKSDKLIDNINATFRASIGEIQTFSKEALESIKRIINANPSAREEILKELEKEFNIIDAFDESIDIKERYEKLLSLKNSAVIYHPKFDEVLKYVLAGNTVCLTGPSKCGKTNLVKELANLLNLRFYNIGNIYDETSQLNGYSDLNTNYNKTTFHRCFENGGITLIKNIDNAPMEAIYTLNNIISNFKYNPYIFGDKKITNPSPNFRLIMTNNDNLKLDGGDIDNLVRIKLDYNETYENSLTKDNYLLEFLHSLRDKGLNITTSTFQDITHHLDLGLISIEELLINYIIENNSRDLLKRTSEEISGDNKYNNVLKKILKG